MEAFLSPQAKLHEVRAWVAAHGQDIDEFMGWLKRQVPKVSFDRLAVSGLA